MVWGAFTKGGTLNLAFPTTRMNTREYLDVLESRLLPFLNENNQNRFIFQQDNARIHVSREAMAFFRDENIDLLEWPACSPDMNPIENLWGVVVRRLYQDNKQYATVNELKHSLEEVWRNLEPEILVNFVNSMRSRVFELIRKNGKETHY